jgi:hypothetical protein
MEAHVDELRLPTCAFERHHCKPRDRCRDVGRIGLSASAG